MTEGQTDTAQTDTAQAAEGQTDTAQAAEGQTDTAQAAEGQTDTAQAAEGQTDTAQDAEGQTDTAQDAEGQTDTAQDAEGFTLPEGVEFDVGAVKDRREFYSGLGLTTKQQQALVDSEISASKSGLEAQEAQVEAWINELKHDKDYGGDNFEKNKGVAFAAVETFGSAELKSVLEESGLGNNPHLFKMMVNIGKLLKEDNPGQGGAASGNLSTVDILYPKREG